MSTLPEDHGDPRAQVTRNRMNERPFLKIGISTSDIESFKTKVDQSKYTPKKKRNVIKRDSFNF